VSSAIRPKLNGQLSNNGTFSDIENGILIFSCSNLLYLIYR
jgi:hypothetical protein